MELLKDPDSELVAACRDPNSEGFESAFEQLYLRYRDRVYSIAFRITCNAVDAMDVVQDSFGLVFRKLESFRSNSLFSTWLFRIVVNCSIDLRRRSSVPRNLFGATVAGLIKCSAASQQGSNNSDRGRVRKIHFL